MSKLVLSGDTSGSVTLDAPAVSGTTTLTLPATSGTLIYSDASANLQFNSGYGSVATAYGCRAWVNFNGTGTVAIRASGNVTSITDNGTGDYTINMTTSMPDTNYSILGFARRDNDSAAAVAIVTALSSATKTSSAIRIIVDYGTNVFDTSEINVAIFR